MNRKFRSCFIVDVNFKGDIIVLSDNARNKFYVNLNNANLVTQFKTWFKEIFTKGIAQTLTIFEYELVDVSECETLTVVKNFVLDKMDL